MNEKQTKPRFVEVIRHLRPSLNNSWFFDDKFEKNSNLYGVTVAFKMDYEEKVVFASWTVCNGENFSKKEGTERAKESDVIVEFDLSSVDTYFGLLPALILHLGVHIYGEEVNQFELLGEYQNQHKLFSDALRKFRQMKKDVA